MFVPLYEGIDGVVLLDGYAPDGDSVRFVPNDPTRLAALARASRLRVSNDGSVQLRLEGIDAPELHYAQASQPRGPQSRDALLTWLGVTGTTYAADGATIASASVSAVPASILANMVDARGRVIAYLLRARPRPSARRHHASTELVRESANYALLAAGHVYPLVYTSLPYVHRALLRGAARRARDARRGVWRDDVTTRGFLLRSTRSLAPGGALVLPKLFRRCVDYIAQRYAYGLQSTFVEWLSGHGTGGRGSPDRVVIAHAANVLLSTLVREHNRHIALTVDVNDIVFVEE